MPSRLAHDLLLRLGTARRWGENLARLVRGRPPWSAEREFAYYQVEPALVEEHRRRQEDFAREAYVGGLRIARALGLLDRRLVEGAAILDLGAGECLLSGALAVSLGAREVWATDAVPKQIWAAAQHHRGRGGLHFLIADARSLPFQDGSFDIVTANLVLHHIEPLGPLLEEARRLLRPGGLFRAFEPAPLLGMLAHDRTSENEAPVRPAKVLAALAAAGFVDGERRYFWSRLESGALGPLSPGYRVSARRAGEAPGPAAPRLVRTLSEMALPNLLLDEGCLFSGLAREQERAILEAAPKLRAAASAASVERHGSS